MFLVRILRYFLGTVCLAVRQGSPERFLNYAAHAGIRLWGIRREGETLYVCVAARRFKKLRPAAQKAGVEIRIVERKGVPFLFYRYRKRGGVLFGIVLFLILVWFFSGFIWTVDISGNKEVARSDIEQTLSDCGLKPGAYRLLLNLRQIENNTLMKMTDLSWITINLKGSTAYVEVKERDYPPELVPLDKPCNVKASQTGQIVKLEAYEGMTMVKKGDTVKKGDIIVSGVIEEKSGAVRLAHASAKVIARTERELSVQVKTAQTVRTPAGKVIRKSALVFPGFAVPLYAGGMPQGDYLRTSTYQPVKIGEIELPFGLKTYEFTPYRTEKVTLTVGEALEKAQQQIARKEGMEFSGMTVLTKQYSTATDAEGLTLTGRYACEENIAYEEEIKIS